MIIIRSLKNSSCPFQEREQKTAANHWSQSGPGHPVTQLEKGLPSLFQAYEETEKNSATFRTLPLFLWSTSQRSPLGFPAKTGSPNEK